MILGRTPLTTSRFVPQIVNVFFFGLLNVHVVFLVLLQLSALNKNFVV